MTDAVVGGLWAAVQLALLTGLWGVSARLFPGDTAAPRLMHTVVLYWVVVTSACLALGCSGLLAGPAILATGLSLSVVLTVAGRRRTGAGDIARRAGRSEVLLPACLLVMGAFWAGVVVTAGVWVFPTDADSLARHLPLVDSWLQTGSLHAPDAPGWFHPGGNELLAVWAVAPFTGDFFAGLNNLPAGLLLAAAAANLARCAGLASGPAGLAAIGVTSTPVFYRQLVTNANDLAVAALFLTALAYAARWSASGLRADLLLGAAGVGLLAGIAFYAAGYAALAVAVATGLAWATRGRRAAAVTLLAWLAGVVALAGYWYARDGVVTGMPDYAAAAGTWAGVLLGAGGVFRAVGAASQAVGPAHFAAVLLVPLTFAGLVAARGPWRAPRTALGFALVGSLLLLAATPGAVETEPGTLNMLRGPYLPGKFAQPFLALSLLGLLVCLSDLCSRPSRSARLRAFRWVGTGIAAVLVGWQFLGCLEGRAFHHGRAVDSLLIGGGLCAVALAGFVGWRQVPWATAAGLGCLVVAGAGMATDRVAERWHQDYAAAYDAYFRTRVLSELAVSTPAGTRLCVIEERCYPFFGSARQYRVCRPGRASSYPDFARDLLAADCSLLVSADRSPLAPDVAAGIADRPAVFEDLAAGESYLLVRIDRRALTAPR